MSRCAALAFLVLFTTTVNLTSQERIKESEPSRPSPPVREEVGLAAENVRLLPEADYSIEFELKSLSDLRATAWCMRFDLFFEDGTRQGGGQLTDYAMATIKEFPEGEGFLEPGESRIVRSASFKSVIEHKADTAPTEVDVRVTCAVFEDLSVKGDKDQGDQILRSRQEAHFARRFWQRRIENTLTSWQGKELLRRLASIHNSLQEGNSRYSTQRFSSEDEGVRHQEALLAQSLPYPGHVDVRTIQPRQTEDMTRKFILHFRWLTTRFRECAKHVPGASKIDSLVDAKR